VVKQVLKDLEAVAPGDLIAVEWFDASIGKSSASGAAIDVPVQSWGVYVGLIGNRVKHIVIAQNSFRYSNGFFDLDYTAIPIGWALGVHVLVKGHISGEVANQIVNSFMVGGHRALRHPRMVKSRVFQMRLSEDGRPN